MTEFSHASCLLHFLCAFSIVFCTCTLASPEPWRAFEQCCGTYSEHCQRLQPRPLTGRGLRYCRAVETSVAPAGKRRHVCTAQPHHTSRTKCDVGHFRAWCIQSPKRSTPSTRAAPSSPLRGRAHDHRGPHGRRLRRTGAHGGGRSMSSLIPVSVYPKLRAPQNVAF